ASNCRFVLIQIGDLWTDLPSDLPLRLGTVLTGTATTNRRQFAEIGQPKAQVLNPRSVARGFNIVPIQTRPRQAALPKPTPPLVGRRLCLRGCLSLTLRRPV